MNTEQKWINITRQHGKELYEAGVSLYNFRDVAPDNVFRVFHAREFDDEWYALFQLQVKVE